MFVSVGRMQRGENPIAAHPIQEYEVICFFTANRMVDATAAPFFAQQHVCLTPQQRPIQKFEVPVLSKDGGACR